MDPHNHDALASKEALEYWSPVDWYNGGMEHTTLHLLYSRFWHKFLYDIGVVPTKEPYAKRTSHGMILGSNGEKMSKSKGNVINPDDIVNEFGADAFRVYEMFMGPFDKPISSCDWPEYDENKTIDDEIEIPVQVNGKLKTTIAINLDEDESSIKEKVHLALEGKLDGKSIVKEIYVKNKIFNVVVK